MNDNQDYITSGHLQILYVMVEGRLTHVFLQSEWLWPRQWQAVSGSFPVWHRNVNRAGLRLRFLSVEFPQWNYPLHYSLPRCWCWFYINALAWRFFFPLKLPTQTFFIAWNNTPSHRYPSVMLFFGPFQETANNCPLTRLFQVLVDLFCFDPPLGLDHGLPPGRQELLSYIASKQHVGKESHSL